jgi:hypothetical protein
MQNASGGGEHDATSALRLAHRAGVERAQSGVLAVRAGRVASLQPELRERIPWTHVGAIGVIVALYFAVLPFSIMHLDLARDIAHGLAIARGERFPMEGPVLASSVHAGPLWYYVLALPLSIGSTWLGVTLAIGAIAALKFPLAYVAGTRIVDRKTGLLWALLLLYPGWMTFEGIVQNHASLVATFTLAVLVAALLYLDSGSRRALGLAGLLYGVALHAHPSAAGIGLLLLAAIGWRARRAATSWIADLAIVALATIVPFAPYLWSQATSGFPDFTRAAAFVGDPAAVGSLKSVPALLGATLVGGGQVVASDLLSQLPAARELILGATLLVLSASACGIVAALRQPAWRTTIVAGVAAVLVLAASVAAIRALTPFYMTFVVWTIAAGVVAGACDSASAFQPSAGWDSVRSPRCRLRSSRRRSLSRIRCGAARTRLRSSRCSTSRPSGNPALRRCLSSSRTPAAGADSSCATSRW